MTVLGRHAGAVKSSNVAIGAAAVFVALSALLGLLPERADTGALGDWALRGAIVPAAFAAPAPHRAAMQPHRSI